MIVSGTLTHAAVKLHTVLVDIILRWNRSSSKRNTSSASMAIDAAVSLKVNRGDVYLSTSLCEPFLHKREHKPHELE